MKEHKEAVTNIMENVKNEMLLRLESEYQRGLEDAWEWARKIMIYEYQNGISNEQFHKIFDTVNRAYVLKHLTAREVMQKIKDYNERQTENNAWKKHIYEEVCLLANDEECSVDEIAEVLEQMRKESHEV